MTSPFARHASRLGEWCRHHMAALLSTALDFLVMIGVVEIFAASAAVATGIGAAFGGACNFQLGRHFTYGATYAKTGDQALRYALVSIASLGLNAAGEHAVVQFTPVHYVLGRIVVAFLISNLWNYPMQKHFVFSRVAPRPERA